MNVLATVGIICAIIIIIAIILTQSFNGATTEIKVNLDEFNHYALDLVNENRKNRDLTELTLGNNPSAQDRANDLLQNSYFSHWNSEGVKPYVVYTKSDGKGLVLENIARTEWNCTSYCEPDSSDILKEINLHNKNMMYNDAHVNWAHRDTLLDQYSTQVNFGIAYNDKYFYFVQHFERNIIKWSNVSIEPNNHLTLTGTIPINFTLSEMLVYEDPNPRHVTTEELNNEKPYTDSTYDRGVLVGVIIPETQDENYPECENGKIDSEIKHVERKCVNYTQYTNNAERKNEIKISVDVSQWLNQNNNIHTIYLRVSDLDRTYTIDVTSLTLEYL